MVVVVRAEKKTLADDRDTGADFSRIGMHHQNNRLGS